MPVPFPSEAEVDLGPVGEAETSHLAAGAAATTKVGQHRVPVPACRGNL